MESNKIAKGPPKPKEGLPTDPVSSVRSRIMRSVRSRDTGPEMRLRRALWALGARYRVQPQIAGTRPDLAFHSARVALFVDGCFWHGCPRHYGLPKSNVNFWKEKLARNMERDTRDRLRLEAADWEVLRVWQCEIKEDVEEVAQRVRNAVEARRAIRFGRGGKYQPRRSM